MAQKIKLSRKKSPRQKVIKPKESSSEDSSEDSDAENQEPIRIRRSIPEPKEVADSSGRVRNYKGRTPKSMLKNLQIDMNDSTERKKRTGARSRVKGTL